jgi:uncharacterized protein (TIGR03435 family)
MKPNQVLDDFFERRANPSQQWIDASDGRLRAMFGSDRQTPPAVLFVEADEFPAEKRFQWRVAFASVVLLGFAVVVSGMLIRSRVVPEKPVTVREEEPPLLAREEIPAKPGVSLQQPLPPVAFEAATIKPTPLDARNNGSMILFPPGRFRHTNATLRDLIRLAYAVQDYQISGGPGWVKDDRYDVEAKAESDVPRDQILVMLRTLLAERFKLKVRETTEEASVYRLVVGKTGPKMLPASESNSPNARINKYEGKRTIPRFAEYLAGIIGQPVVDGTGLTGPYDIKLEFTPDWVRERFVGRGGTVQMNGNVLDLDGPSLSTALETQLGLRLEGSKGAVRFLVIESVDKPSEN